MKLWSQDKVKEAVFLLSQGYTTAEVADKMNERYGTDFSKDAIRIKVNREGYSTRGSSLKNLEESQNAINAKLSSTVAEGFSTSSKVDELSKDLSDLKDKVATIKTTSSGDTEADVECLFNTKRKFTPDELLDLAGLSDKDFTLKQVKGSKWSVVTTKYGRKWNFYASVVATPKVASLDAMVEEINATVKPLHIEREKTGKRNLVIPLPDMHFGWTTYADVRNKVNQIQDITKNGYDTIVIEQLGDLFHSDQMHSSQTVRGTILDDVDMRAAFRYASQFFEDIIPTAISNSKHVRYYTVFGNHSGDLEYAYALALKAKYPQVEFILNDDAPQTDWRCAYLLGHIGIMMAHGDVAKNRLTGLFPVEYKAIWSQARTTEIHSGHYHSERFRDDQGIMWRQLGTAKPNDEYEIKNGFTGSKRVMYVFEYDDSRLRVTYEL